MNTIEAPEKPAGPALMHPSPKPIVYACSGCSDAGELADRVARALTRQGVAEMSCLAGIGGRVKSLLSKGQKAQRILVIDGCPLNYARHTLELAGLKAFEHLGLNDIGLRKGNCPVTDERIAAGVAAAKDVLDTPNGKPMPSAAPKMRQGGHGTGLPGL